LKFNYKITIEYLGTGLVGWQIQKKGSSVQSIIEKALTKTLKKKIKVIGSGRTDAGVNALEQTANFFSETKIQNTYKFLSSVNYFLSGFPISLTSIKKINLSFHARHDAKKRVYEYIITNRKFKLALDKDRSWLVKNLLELKKMKKAANYFLGTHDFSAFRSSKCSAYSPIRKISKFKIKKEKDKIIFLVESKSFLQKQVRSMVGCLKYVGESKWKPEKIREILKLKKRSYCAPPAPPEGLYLKKVFY